MTALDRLSADALPSGWRDEVVALLLREVERYDPALDPESEASHACGEYLVDLVRLVVLTDDPAAVGLLAFIGIDIGRGVRQFMARYPERALEALTEAWSEREPLRADIVLKLGEMLDGSTRGFSELDAAQRRAVDRLFFDAASDTSTAATWALVDVVASQGLVERRVLAGNAEALLAAIDSRRR